MRGNPSSTEVKSCQSAPQGVSTDPCQADTKKFRPSLLAVQGVFTLWDGSISFIMHHRKPAAVSPGSQRRSESSEHLVPPSSSERPLSDVGTLARLQRAGFRWCMMKDIEPSPRSNRVLDSTVTRTRFQELGRPEMSPVIQSNNKSYCTSSPPCPLSFLPGRKGKESLMRINPYKMG